MDKKKLSFKDIMINYGVIIIVVLLVIYTGITSKNFLSVNNLTNILMNMSSRLVIALGIAGCIITAGCDLSAGRMIGLGGCIAGTLLQKMDYSQKFFPNMNPMNIFLALLIVMLVWKTDGFLLLIITAPAVIISMTFHEQYSFYFRLFIRILWTTKSRPHSRMPFS